MRSLLNENPSPAAGRFGNINASSGSFTNDRSTVTPSGTPAADHAYFDTMEALIQAKSRTLEGVLAKVHVAQTTDPQADLDRSIIEDLAEMFGVIEKEEEVA